MPGLSLRLLGGASLLDADGRPLGGRATHRHRLGLLAVLAAAAPSAVTRDRLIGLLWPERDETAARHLLRAALHELRYSLGPAALPSGTTDVRLEPRALVVDLHAFEAALAAGDLAGAAARYGGPFLDGFHLDEAQAFDEWASAERARLAARHEEALLRLARSAGAQGDAGAAARWWRQLAAIRPTDGALALAATEALAAAGDPAGALALAATHERQLRAEHGVAPSPALGALVRSLRAPTVDAQRADTPATGAPIAAAPATEAPIASPAVAVAAPRPTPTYEPPVAAPLAPAPAPAPPTAGRARRGGRRRSAWLAAAGVGLAVLAVVAPRPASRDRSDAVAVLPFVVAGGAPADLATGLPILLSANLDQVTELRVLSPHTAAARAAAARRSGDDATPERLAQALGAGSVVTGVVSATAQGLEVRATLVGADGAVLTRATVRGAADSLPALVDRVSLAVLRELWGRRWGVPEPRLAAVSTSSPEALRAYLRGEAFLRAARWDSAASALAQAVDADSTFALAHLRLAEPYGWRYGMASEPARRALAAATRFADRLPPRDRQLLELRRLHEAGNLAAVERADALAARYPVDAEVQYVHADVRFHASVALGDAMAAASAASFDTAMALDTGSVRVLGHPITLALQRGDTARFDRAVARLQALGGGSHFQVDRPFDYALLRAVRFAGPEASLRALVERLRRDRPPAWQVAELSMALERATLGGAPPRPDLLFAGYDAIEAAYRDDADVRAMVAGLRRSRLVLLGRLERARPLLAMSMQVGLVLMPVAYGYAPPGWTTGYAERIARQPDWSATPQRRREAAYWLALLAIADGDAATARARLREAAIPPSDTASIASARAYAGALQAAGGWVRLIEGDTAAAIREMDAGFRAVGYDGQMLNLAASTRVRWLRLLADRPDRRLEAADVLQASGIQGDPMTGAHALLARALAAVGDSAGAARERAHAAAIAAGADPKVRAALATARDD